MSDDLDQPSAEPSAAANPAVSPAATGPKDQSASGNRWWLLGALAVLALITVLAYPRLAQAPPPVPLPKELDGLEPLLRSYIIEQADWVRQSPRQAKRHATLGLVYAANGLWSEARLAFENAVRLDPSEPLAHLYAAVSLEELGAQEEAIPRLRRLVVQFPDFAPGSYRLGEALLRAGKLHEAAPAFQRLIELAPGEWRGYAGLGDIKTRTGDAAGGAQLLEKAVQLDARAKPAHHLLGQAYQRLGRTNEARRELRLGLNALHYPMPDPWAAQAPQHMRLLSDLVEMAREYREAGLPGKAVAVLEPALPFHTNNVSLLNNLAIACQQAGQGPRARDLVNRALRLDPRSVPAHVTLSAVLLAQAQNEEALREANQAVDLAPNNAQPCLAKANALLALERDTEALAALQAAARLDPQNAPILVDTGDVCLRNLNRPQEALEHYTRAVQLDPVCVPALLRLADLQLRLGNLPEAQGTIEAAQPLAPGEPALKRLEQRLQKRQRL